MRLLVAATIVLLIAGGLHTYLWWRLVASTGRSRRWRLTGAAALAGMAGILLIALRLSGMLPSALDTGFALVGYIWLAVVFYLMVTLLVLEPVRIVAWLVARRQRGRELVRATAPTADDTAPAAEAPTKTSDELARDFDPGRRLFLSRAMAVGAGVVAAGTVGYGTTQALGTIGVKRVPITLAKLAPAFDGYRIVLLSDIHLSRILHRQYLAEVVRTVNTLDAGLVSIVGDLVDGSVAELGDDAAPLADLTSKHGTFFVTGNHEYYGSEGAQEWVEYLPDLDVKVLRNERVEITQGGTRFDLAGVDDANAAQSGEPGHGTDMAAALDGRDTDRPAILMAHQPVLWPDAVDKNVDLQLSGHTHGGQMWPFHYFVGLDQPVRAGLERDGDSQIYVTNGVGFWGPPVRVGAPPEITVVELRAPR